MDTTPPPPGVMVQVVDVLESVIYTVYPVFLVIGAAGNLLSMVIFTRKRNSERASSLYLLVLSVVDSLNVATGAHIYLFMSGVVSDFAADALWCKVRVYAFWLGTHLSAWILVLFTAERSLVIMFPLRMNAVDSGRGKRVALTLLSLSVILMYVYPAFLVEPIYAPGKIYCSPRADIPFLNWYISIVQVWISNVIPILWIPVGNVIILYGIRKHQLGDDAKHKQNNLKMLKNLVLISSAQFVFTTPFTVALVYRDFTGQASAYSIKIRYMMGLFGRIAYFINPCLYVFSLDYFRNEAKKILLPCLTSRKGSGETSQATVYSSVTK